MARIRSIKPEFCTSEQITECSPTARLLFACMWCFCDDNGIHPAAIKRLKMEVFPADSFTTSQIQEWVTELLDNGLLREYEVDGVSYWQVTGWHHQKIDRPTAKHPLPLAEHSTRTRRGLDDRSPPEGKGRDIEGIGGEPPLPPEGNGIVPAKVDLPSELDTPGFREAWKDLTEYRKKLRVKAYTPQSTAEQWAFLVKQPDPIACIRQTIRNGWRGIFELKETKNGKQPRPSIATRAAAINEELRRRSEQPTGSTG